MTVPHSILANTLRVLAMDAVQVANSGHPGMPMGMADVVTVLFRHFLKFSPNNPDWHDRDRFILSAGHGSMLLYALLHLTGYKDFTLDELKRFRQLGARTAGHPEYGHGAGIETTTGPLGQGLANAVGMAMAEQLLTNEFGDSLCNHRTWTIVGDGCLMEGISHEAASLAGHLQLNKLIVLFDDNGISIDGKTSLTTSDSHLKRFSAYNWLTLSCDGHDEKSIKSAMRKAIKSDKPTIIACKTEIGFGSPNKKGTASAHGSPLGTEEITATRAALNWEFQPFVIPDNSKLAWLKIGQRNKKEYEQWKKRFDTHPQNTDFQNRMTGKLSSDWDNALIEWQKQFITNPEGKMATRQASGKALENIVPNLPALLGGSADLTPSNNTYVGQTAIKAKSLRGRYIHYGVREHLMAAAMNGIALHGGYIPYAGTFLVFSDYCRPAIRLSALMGIRVIYVMTHDSIGLGEDGPTHQPIEHLTSLRTMPNLQVFRPCDAAETAVCWQLAISRDTGPSLLALSRQSLPHISGHYITDCWRGGYVLSDSPQPRHITLVASGSEVSLALKAQDILRHDNIHAAVVSMPCMENFLAQDDKWHQTVLPCHIPVIAIEAASAMSWQSLIGKIGITQADYLCMDSFGISAPADDAYRHFGITVDACVSKAKKILAQ